MHPKGRNHPPAKFYQQDIVQRIGPDQSLGIVLRCWHDAEDVPPQTVLTDPMMRPLRPGEVGVSFLADGGEREILPESELRLIDRSIQPGDFCKRSIDDVQSGVVTNVHVKGRIEHVISGETVEGWTTLDDLETRLDAEIGDYVVHDDWIGQVIELFDESLIQSSNGQLVKLPELSSRLSIGEKGNDIIPPPTGGMYNLFGSFFSAGSSRPDSVDTVIDVKHTVYAVAWLAVSQMIDSAIAETKTRPQKFWSGKDIGKLTLIRGRSDLEMRVGDRVRLKDNTGHPFTRHCRNDTDEPFEVRLFIVTETETTLDVLWQDGTKEIVRSTEVIPYLNPDEYDSWPGDHVVWKSEENRRHAIVQSVNATDRMAKVLLPDTNTIELVSVLELDPHGTSDPNPPFPQSVSDGLGVCRGDFVFIHPDGATNGFLKPVVPKIGEVEPWVRENPIVDGQLGGWRKEMARIGAAITTEGSWETSMMNHPVLNSGNFTWIGEVTELKLDGTIEVTHPDSTVEIYPLQRLTKLYDGMEQLETALWEDDGDSSDDHSGDESEQIWSMDEDSVWQPDLNEGDWEDYEDDEMQSVEDDSINVVSDGWEDEPMNTSTDETNTSTPEAPLAQNIRPRPALEGLGTTDKCATGTTLTWNRFEILSSAPLDHAFISSPPAQPSKSFLSRLTKEYRVLSTSLPDTIIVRAYEDRTDLLRSLIIGPENTPYEDAPMMIDWMLDSNFPHSPPIAHFHSWTNGNGRGTWSGDRDEIWSAARSSLLQAFVSIQGLVLVKEPRLYNEKAYVLSRAFVRRALEVPPGSLDSEIKWLYYDNHRLDKVLRDARALIKKSTTSQVKEADQELAVPRLTAGGIITLERTLSKLQLLLTNRSS
ncbi:hypothetical protein C0995_011885 [Termitomyces sp. Mi166|nr:hypothetical protein C0995_011885 [Termitomyces sp. Mi166\